MGNNLLRVLPVPAVFGPPGLIIISARFDEFEILAVGHFVPVDLEPRDFERLSFELVIPTKHLRASGKAECYFAVRNENHALSDRFDAVLRFSAPILLDRKSTRLNSSH